MLLNFFLEQQEKLAQLQLEQHSLEELKDNAIAFLQTKKNEFSFSSVLQSASDFPLIPNYIVEDEFLGLFHVVRAPAQEQSLEKDIFSHDIFGMFTSPLSDSWKEEFVHKRTSSIAIRTGFFRSECEIYRTLLMGFQAMTMYVAGLDRFQIQLLTEIGRDYGISLLFIVHSKQELLLLLETDAPYICLSGYEPKKFGLNMAVLYQLNHLVPKSAVLMAFAPRTSIKDPGAFKELGFSGLLLSQ